MVLLYTYISVYNTNFFFVTIIILYLKGPDVLQWNVGQTQKKCSTLLSYIHIVNHNGTCGSHT